MTEKTQEYKGSILVVDDNPDDLRLISNLLKGQGYHVRPAPSGDLAISGARANPPDLVLLDVAMPGLDGYQVCGELKKDEKTRGIPVIFISVLDGLEEIVKSFSAGGVEYIIKPYKEKEVLARVENHMALKRMQKELEEKNRRLKEELAERQRMEEELKDYAASQVILVKEINHRVKNNLAILISLINLEKANAEFTEYPGSQPHLERLSWRIRGLLEVHDMLSDSGWRPLEMKELCRRVTAVIIRTLPASGAVEFTVDTFPPGLELAVESSTAHHLTMLLNEVVVNSIKYAFEESSSARFSVETGREEIDEKKIYIRLADNGPGFPEDILRSQSGGTGFELIRLIAEHNLDGEVSFSNHDGAVVRVVFPEPGAGE
jgi:two-component sensor histidine kinase